MLARIHYAKHVFLHQVGSASQVVYYGVSGARNISALFFVHGYS
jgi:hypothetical protein